MQLLLILALMLLGGKGNAQNLLSEVKPVLESLGGEEIQNALKSAEELSSVLSAVGAFTAQPSQSPTSEQTEASPALGFPLAPVSKIADKDITYCLSRYISQN